MVGGGWWIVCGWMSGCVWVWQSNEVGGHVVRVCVACLISLRTRFESRGLRIPPHSVRTLCHMFRLTPYARSVTWFVSLCTHVVSHVSSHSVRTQRHVVSVTVYAINSISVTRHPPPATPPVTFHDNASPASRALLFLSLLQTYSAQFRPPRALPRKPDCQPSGRLVSRVRSRCRTFNRSYGALIVLNKAHIQATIGSAEPAPSSYAVGFSASRAFASQFPPLSTAPLACWFLFLLLFLALSCSFSLFLTVSCSLFCAA
ncbi:LAQU0S01e06590g1_1 [Lachancea quebecensis]|uniref:LAQU0S01e06590g1_1 n=1 Tax=Lachancea quebecensis TaxID=1654605 RepID=A0A0N7MKU3_9SACH|nr:LAQU0S01e06590g1_1 [Lachancea quebecensis]